MERRVVSRVAFFWGMAATATAACHGPSMLYEQTNPARFAACPNPISEKEVPTQSYAALLKALAEHGWRFDSISPQTGSLVATACLKGGPECVTMIFQVDERGDLIAFKDPNQEILDEMDGHMIRWMRFTDQKFSLYRCMSPDLALEELKKYGALQQSSPPPSPAAQPPAPAPDAREGAVESPSDNPLTIGGSSQ